jgi:transcriptional regulator with XRE-family HTH domain
MNSSSSEEILNKEYRHGLVDAQIEIDLPLQIRALRKQLVGEQKDMAKLTGMKQPRISAMEKPGKVHFSLETLRRLAEAFDVALIVRFAPFSELLDWSGRFNPDAFRVPSFEEEAASQEPSALPKLPTAEETIWSVPNKEEAPERKPMGRSTIATQERHLRWGDSSEKTKTHKPDTIETYIQGGQLVADRRLGTTAWQTGLVQEQQIAAGGGK